MHAAELAPSPRWQGVFYLAIAVLLGCGGVATWQYLRFADASARVDHAHEVLGAIDAVLDRLVDAETAYRGYLLTGDAAFLEPYLGVTDTARAAVVSLTELVADNPPQQTLARQLDALATQKVSEMTAVVALRQDGRVDEAVQRIRGGDGKRLMDAIRSVAEAMQVTETSALVLRAEQVTLARTGAVWFSAISLVMAVVLAFAASSVRRQFERRRLDLEHEMAARLQAQQESLARAAALQRSESFNRSVLDSTGDSIQVIDRQGRILLFNAPGLRLHEVDEAATYQDQPWTTFWGSESGLAAQAIDSALTSGGGRFRAFRPTDKGRPKWWDVIVTPIPDDAGRVERLVTIARDITEERRAEEERAQLLASERRARTEAERSARLKDEFVSTLSHELRSPLNAILGWVGVLKRDRTPETLSKAIDVIDRNSRRQSQMVDDLLDVSRIMSGKMRLDVQRLDVASVIEEALASAKPAADAKGVRLVQVLGSAAIVQGDPGRVQQVVWNLVSNAIKFTPRGGIVQVTLRKVNSHVHIQVSDTGQGIRSEVLPYIFERFRQGDMLGGREQGGLGLGLAIVKNLVEMHGGTVDAASEGVGRGSVFTVRLPLALASSRAQFVEPPLADVDEAASMLLDGLTVMVLDDEADARELVQRLLEDAGARVTAAASAEAALAALDAGLVPQVIVSDIGLPDVDGYEFMSRVRRRADGVATVPAAALTALARVDDRKRALMAGYQAHLAKPVDPAELVALIASMAGRTGRVSA